MALTAALVAVKPKEQAKVIRSPETSGMREFTDEATTHRSPYPWQECFKLSRLARGRRTKKSGKVLLLQPDADHESRAVAVSSNEAGDSTGPR